MASSSYSAGYRFGQDWSALLARGALLALAALALLSSLRTYRSANRARGGTAPPPPEDVRTSGQGSLVRLYHVRARWTPHNTGTGIRGALNDSDPGAVALLRDVVAGRVRTLIIGDGVFAAEVIDDDKKAEVLLLHALNMRGQVPESLVQPELFAMGEVRNDKSAVQEAAQAVGGGDETRYAVVAY